MLYVESAFTIFVFFFAMRGLFTDVIETRTVVFCHQSSPFQSCFLFSFLSHSDLRRLRNFDTFCVSCNKTDSSSML